MLAVIRKEWKSNFFPFSHTGMPALFMSTCKPSRLRGTPFGKMASSPVQMIFVNSMSDLFHTEVPAAFIEEIFFTMNQARWHTFQILTKRADRLLQLAPRLKWTPNVWMGVTVDNDQHVDRIDRLREVPAAVRFLSLEPLLGPLPKLNLTHIDWVILGGESGPGARPMNPAWVIDLRDQCLEANVAFFFKQWGGVRKKKAGRLLEKRTWDQMPRETAMA